MLLCAACYDKEQSIPASESVTQPSASETRIAELTNKLDKEIPANARLFHVTEVTSIVEIESQVNSDESITDKNLVIAQLVESRLNKFKHNLFQLKEIEVELKTDMVTDQRYLNHLVPQLREEERAKFRAYDISYKPSVVIAPSVPKQRLSASDKAYASYAAKLGITIEEAKSRILSGLQLMKIECTCSVTPGICRLHSSEK